MSTPKIPNQRPLEAPRCDPQLPVFALQHRREHNLMSAADFRFYNVTAWRLEKRGVAEYIVGHNITIGELERQFGPSVDNPARFGLHAEPLLAATLTKRRDVLRGETLVTQIFTERIPCRECHLFLEGVPYLRYTPRYFYLDYADKKWQVQQAGDWSRFLMNCYRLL